VVSRKGVLVIPAFSVGRSQEVLFYLQTLRDQKRIPHVPVYLDSPMSNEATQVFLQHEEDHQFSQTGNGFTPLIRADSYQCVTSTDESMLLCMRDGPLIVISAAGMLSGGRILHHVKHRVSDSKNAILFIGYQAQGSKGRFLLTHPPSIRIHHEEHAVEADILSIESLSAHADYQDSIDWIDRFHQQPKRIFLNHGEPPALKALQEKLMAKFKSEVIIVDEGVLYPL
jgi:metallo-beta-lactamase family protein